MNKAKCIALILSFGMMMGCSQSSVSSTGEPVTLSEREQFIASLSFDDFFGVMLPDDSVGDLSLVTVSDGKVLQESPMLKDSNIDEVWAGFALNEEAYESNNLYTYDVTVAVYDQEREMRSKWTIEADSHWLDDKSEDGGVSSRLYQPTTFNSNEKYQILGALYIQTLVRDIDEVQLFDCSGITDMQNLYQNISDQVDIAYLIVYETNSDL